MDPALYFDPCYHGEPFVLFGAGHLTGLGIVVAGAFALSLSRRRWTERAKRGFRFALAGGLLALELGRHAWFAVHGLWQVQDRLPLELCAISAWLSICALAFRSRAAYEPLYFLGLGGATQALITPNVAPYSFPHWLAIQSYVSHGGIVLAALYLTLVEGFRPTPASLRRVILWVSAYVPVVLAINWAIGGNYLFLAAKPAFPTAMDWMPAWPWYIGMLIALALAVALLLYLPFLIADRRAARPTGGD